MPRISQKSLRAVTLRQAQEMTGRIWARHRSTVPDPAAFQSDITRHALGRSHLSLVVCQSPIAVDADGCQDRAFLYLPISGQLQLSIGSNRLSAGPDDVAIVSPRTPHRLEATPVRCIVIEISMDRLASELSAKGFSETDVSAQAWKADSAEAASATMLARFLLAELSDNTRPPPSKRYLLRMEAVLLNCLARGLSGTHKDRTSDEFMIGRRTATEVQAWMQSRLTEECSPGDLASHAGLTPRSLQRAFLRYFHATPSNCVKGLRLDAAREALISGRGQISVSEVALEHLFHHLGRFAAAYRQRFGESPSETLAALKKNR
jgi:AraC-like DNA-binding protein/mannose-6-phosphate isomerase-like protein (cupin superfamily)